jgi:hypothetical protein
MPSHAVTIGPDGGVSVAPAFTPSPGPTSSGSPTADVQVGPDGRIVGVDGMLHQIAAALAIQAIPVIRQEILPVLQHDRQTQKQVGDAIGNAIGRQLKPYAVVGAGALTVIAVIQVCKYQLKKRLAQQGLDGASQGRGAPQLNAAPA